MRVLARSKPDGGGDVSGDGWPTGPAPSESYHIVTSGAEIRSAFRLFRSWGTSWRKASTHVNAEKIQALHKLKAIGPEFAAVLVGEIFHRETDSGRRQMRRPGRSKLD
jgi:hypothetical protein